MSKPDIKTAVPVREEPTLILRMHPKKFAMWLFIVSVVMLFGGLTSGYIVRRAEGNWLEFDIPSVFYVSTAIIVLSSITMHWAYLSTRKDNFAQLKTALILTFVLGSGFLYTQLKGWQELVNLGVFFAGDQSNPAGSFMYVLSGMHGLHIMGGLVYLLIMLAAAFRMQLHRGTVVRMEMCATYWHFLDILWIYLLVFLVINSQT